MRRMCHRAPVAERSIRVYARTHFGRPRAHILLRVIKIHTHTHTPTVVLSAVYNVLYYYYNNMCTIILSYSCDSAYIYWYTTYINMYDTRRRSRRARYGVLLRRPRRVPTVRVSPSVRDRLRGRVSSAVDFHSYIFAAMTRDRYIII